MNVNFNAPRRGTVLAVFAGIVISTLLYLNGVRSENRALATGFRAEVQREQDLITEQQQLYLDVLVSLSSLHTMSGDVNPDEFMEFVDKGLIYHRQILGVFGWAARVARGERALYEQAMREAGHPDFSIRDFNGDDRTNAAAFRPVYHPVSFVQPPDHARLSLGVDLGSLSAAPEAMADAAATKTAVMVPMPHSNNRLVVLLPIFAEEEAGSVRGFVFTVYDPRLIIEKALADQPRSGLRLYEPGSPPERSFGFLDEIQAGLGNYSYTLQCTPTAAFRDRFRSPQPFILLISGLLITALVGFQIQSMLVRTAKIERQVEVRTAELSEANRKLTEQIERRKELEREVLETSNREKRKIGEDIHDSLGQKLTGLVFISRAIADKLKSRTCEEAEDAERLAVLSREAVGQARKIAKGLSPVDLQEGGLQHALRRLADDTSEIFSVNCRFEGPSAEGPPPDINRVLNLYHIAQEAVNNAIRHGEAAEVVVLLEDNRLTVRDDGKGMPVEQAAEPGMGLKIMRHRAEIIGGRLEIDRVKPHGTRITCRWG